MARSARQAKRVVEDRSPLQEGAVALGGMIARNPVLVGGSTAFLVALFYVSANALWYQPYAHKGAFFSTREVVEFPDMNEDAPETTIKIERPEAQVVRPKGDPQIEQIQSILKDLAFYDGTVDGLNGPATRSAIQAYQKKVGLTATGDIDGALLEQLGAAETTAGIAPTPTPRAQATPVSRPRTGGATTAPVRTEPAVDADPSARIMKIQAGLKAFGNDGIDVDGVPGARTTAAIREFQALFGLPETGEPDPAVYVKMREIGLTN
ncbi:peptidoglycan-binding protein [Aminobacter sp. P9b]|uniref:Peptidoglycan hydrolase-like protein with peptidoglycan-binding domain n=1 Tax=Aminobacter niigataensis TaxID=83265 RepID=A0ABR6L4Z0_9HYPH|nr:peptidoglycan-binding protein [Aminobacter niigataensis]MBB4651833.1 peptidoglycan hydrolase-like protein with peptidoglycan-binding domain [Aminobacter niigataensis]CAI2935674.1 His-Xaa-Ser repeat protein HxsA [Aminobacter niigataensis]